MKTFFTITFLSFSIALFSQVRLDSIIVSIDFETQGISSFLYDNEGRVTEYQDDLQGISFSVFYDDVEDRVNSFNIYDIDENQLLGKFNYTYQLDSKIDSIIGQYPGTSDVAIIRYTYEDENTEMIDFVFQESGEELLIETRIISYSSENLLDSVLYFDMTADNELELDLGVFNEYDEGKLIVKTYTDFYFNENTVNEYSYSNDNVLEEIISSNDSEISYYNLNYDEAISFAGVTNPKEFVTFINLYNGGVEVVSDLIVASLQDYKIDSIAFDIAGEEGTMIYHYSSFVGSKGTYLPAKAISVYPNPSSDQIFLESKDQIIEYAILSVDGQLVKSAVNQSANFIDVLSLNSGIYMITMTTKNGDNFFSRFVKE